MSAIPDGQPKTYGIAAGDEVGARILALPTVESLGATVGYVQPPPGPGVYEPTANATPLGTRLPLVAPLVLDSADQSRPDGPSPLTSDEYSADFQQVKALGRSDSTVRTEQTWIALFWTDHDIPQWNRNLLRLAGERGLGELQSARMLAMAHCNALTEPDSTWQRCVPLPKTRSTPPCTPATARLLSWRWRSSSGRRRSRSRSTAW